MEDGAEDGHVLIAQTQSHHDPDCAEHEEHDGELRRSDVEEVVQHEERHAGDPDGGRVDDAVHGRLDRRAPLHEGLVERGDGRGLDAPEDLVEEPRHCG